jgi:hypothetical protein
MATTLFFAISEAPGTLEHACPNCGQALAKGQIEVSGGETVETVCCPNDCDLRPFTFLDGQHG